MSFALRMAAMIGTLALFASGHAALAQGMAPSVPDALARSLGAEGVDAATGFAMNGPANCLKGGAGDDWAYHCVMALTDSARGEQTAALEIMIFKGDYDFAQEDAKVRAAIARLDAPLKLDSQQDISLTGRGQHISLSASCHQARGETNSAAYCLLPLSSNVLVFSQVQPGQSSSDGVAISQNGGPDDVDDIRHAADLASLGAVAVAKAQQGGAPAPDRELPFSIFKVPPK